MARIASNPDFKAINVTVTKEQWLAVKKAALDEGLSLKAYVVDRIVPAPVNPSK